MTLGELIKTLENRKKGLGNKLWREANLIGASFGGALPDSPESAYPDLYPPKPTYKMPDFLVEKAIKRGVM